MPTIRQAMNRRDSQARDALAESGLVFSGFSADDGLVEIVELDGEL